MNESEQNQIEREKEKVVVAVVIKRNKRGMIICHWKTTRIHQI